jgi:hypothetical protein
MEKFAEEILTTKEVIKMEALQTSVVVIKKKKEGAFPAWLRVILGAVVLCLIVVFLGLG